jgi:hypothetical protein
VIHQRSPLSAIADPHIAFAADPDCGSNAEPWHAGARSTVRVWPMLPEPLSESAQESCAGKQQALPLNLIGRFASRRWVPPPGNPPHDWASSGSGFDELLQQQAFEALRLHLGAKREQGPDEPVGRPLTQRSTWNVGPTSGSFPQDGAALFRWLTPRGMPEGGQGSSTTSCNILRSASQSRLHECVEQGLNRWRAADASRTCTGVLPKGPCREGQGRTAAEGATDLLHKPPALAGSIRRFHGG